MSEQADTRAARAVAQERALARLAGGSYGNADSAPTFWAAVERRPACRLD